MVGEIWKSTNHYVVPASARDVMTVIGSIGVYDIGQQFAWRGLSNADFTFSSSLHRRGYVGERALRTAEEEILREAREWGLGTYPTGRVDDLQLLSDLQHFGIPTRLIDVTSNPMTALWFACQPASAAERQENGGKDKSGLVLALNITGWRRLSTVGQVVTWDSLGDPQGAQLRVALGDESPFVIDSDSPNARMRAQEGFFVSGAVPSGPPMRYSGEGEHRMMIVSKSPFESIHVEWDSEIDAEALKNSLVDNAGRKRGRPRSLPFVAVIIKPSVKRRLLQYLSSTYNRSSRILFPDYQGYREYGRLAQPAVLDSEEVAT